MLFLFQKKILRGLMQSGSRYGGDDEQTPAPGWWSEKRSSFAGTDADPSSLRFDAMNRHDVPRCLRRDGEPGLCLLRRAELPVMTEDHLRRITRFQRHAIDVLNLGKAVTDERMP